ncbi:retinoic acid receptor RXR-alpha-like, partial [Tropilaelaps mercedesae]
LVLFFVHIFPRVKAHPPLNILFSTLFLTAFVYLAAVLSVIIGTATPFMCNLIMFVACWQLMACSLLGVQFDSAKGRWTCALIYLADFIIVAIFLPSRIIDKIVAFFVTVCVAKVQISKVNEVIEKALQEQDAV